MSRRAPFVPIHPRALVAFACLFASSATFAEDSAFDVAFGPETQPGRAIVRFDLVGSDRRDIAGAVFTQGDDYLVAGRVAAGAPGEVRIGIARFDRRGRPVFTRSTATAVSPTQALPAERFDIRYGRDAAARLYVAGTFVTGNQNVDITRVAITRLTADGALDTGYGSGGLATIDLGAASNGSRAEALDLDVAPDGSVVIAGFVIDRTAPVRAEQIVARLRPNGVPDAAFGTGGVTRLSFGTQSPPVGFATRVKRDSQGRILVAGSANVENSTALPTLARLLPDGSLDPGFCVSAAACDSVAFGGKRFLSFGPNSEMNVPTAIAVGAGDAIYASAAHAVDGVASCAVTKLLPDGRTETTFGDDGVLQLVSPGATCETRDLVVSPDGGVLVLADERGGGSALTMLVGRIGADGRFDPSFAPGSNLAGGAAVRVLMPYGNGNETSARTGLIDDDGKLVFVGARRSNDAAAGDDNLDFAIVRLLNGPFRDSFE